MPGLDPCRMLRTLLTTMHTLRAPGGCPWDAGQTPESLTPYLLEEACEAIEAIESGSVPAIADELGDLLLQIVFQAEIFAERGAFDFADVAAGINAKLLRRHPHVFAECAAAGDSVEDLARQWERIKRAEQPAVASAHPLGRLPENLPALQRAQKLLARARQRGIGMEWLDEAGATSHQSITETELGRALLTLVQLAEANGLDAEQALRKTVGTILSQTGNNHALAGPCGE